MSKFGKFVTDEYLNSFGKNLNQEIRKYRSPTANRDEMFEQQKVQLQELYDLEDEFKTMLMEHHHGETAMLMFCDYIKNVRRNTLSARPYFKERSVLMQDVGPAIKNDDVKTLFKYHMNYNLVKYMVTDGGMTQKDFVKIYDKITKLRNEIVICNLPLAINRAKIFFSKTPQSHLEYMDFIQIAVSGLYCAIDKYTPPFTHSFKSVIIGRIVGEQIENYSQTMLHFFPYDKKKLYNANKIAHKFRDKEIDYEALTKELNESGILGEKVTVSEISDILLAASHISADIPKKANNPTITHQEGSENLSIERFADNNRKNPEENLMELSSKKALYAGLNSLSMVEMKIMRLKGALDEDLE